MSDEVQQNEITQDELKAGFIKVYLASSESHFYGKGSITLAVVLPIAQCDILIEIQNPMTNLVEYSRQKYGTYGSSGRADWKPVSSPIRPLQLAMRSVASGSEATLPGYVEVNIATPAMALRCPSCSHEFVLNSDIIPEATEQTCPMCSHAAEIGKFNAYNL